MIRLRAAWKALRGATVIVGADGFIVIHVTQDGAHSVQWRGLDRNSVTLALYQAADSVADTLPEKSASIH